MTLLPIPASLLLAAVALAQVPREEDVRILSIYDVADLVGGGDLEDAGRGDRTSDLAELVRTSALAGREGKDRPRTVVDPRHPGILVIDATEAEHREVLTFLTELRRSASRRVRLEIEVGWHPRGAAIAGWNPPGPVRLGAIEPGHAGPVLAGAFRVAFPSAQLLRPHAFTAGKAIRFVTGYQVVQDVEGHPAGVVCPELSDPGIEGLVGDAFLMPLAGGEVFSLALNLTLREVVRPVAEETALGRVVHRPEFRTRDLRSRIALAPGATYLFEAAGLERSDGASDEVLMLRIRLDEGATPR